MKYEPCARLTTRMTPKIRLRPLASRKSSAPYDRPLKVWMIQNSLLTTRARGSLGEPQHAPGEIRNRAAGVGQEHVQPGKPVENATQDEMGGGDGRVERIAEQVVQVEGLQPVVGADHGERMQQDG